MVFSRTCPASPSHKYHTLPSRQLLGLVWAPPVAPRAPFCYQTDFGLYSYFWRLPPPLFAAPSRPPLLLYCAVRLSFPLIVDAAPPADTPPPPPYLHPLRLRSKPLPLFLLWFLPLHSSRHPTYPFLFATSSPRPRFFTASQPLERYGISHRPHTLAGLCTLSSGTPDSARHTLSQDLMPHHHTPGRRTETHGAGSGLSSVAASALPRLYWGYLMSVPLPRRLAALFR